MNLRPFGFPLVIFDGSLDLTYASSEADLLGTRFYASSQILNLHSCPGRYAFYNLFSTCSFSVEIKEHRPAQISPRQPGDTNQESLCYTWCGTRYTIKSARSWGGQASHQSKTDTETHDLILEKHLVKVDSYSSFSSRWWMQFWFADLRIFRTELPRSTFVECVAIQPHYSHSKDASGKNLNVRFHRVNWPRKHEFSVPDSCSTSPSFSIGRPRSHSQVVSFSAGGNPE
jgi:hypothetical protein